MWIDFIHKLLTTGVKIFEQTTQKIRGLIKLSYRFSRILCHPRVVVSTLSSAWNRKYPFKLHFSV